MDRCPESHYAKCPAQRNGKEPLVQEKAQRWRTGCEGRISVAKRRHGLRRCLYRGSDGMKRWVGLGVLADNLINIGRARWRWLMAEPTRGDTFRGEWAQCKLPKSMVQTLL